MKKVNLRDLYPDVYKNDHFVEVTEDVLETIQSAERAEAAYDRRMYRYKAYYSLDCDNGIENAILMKPQTPEMLLEEKQLREQLYAAVMALPEKQATPTLGMTQKNQPKIRYTIDFDVTPHQLRHTYITNLLYAGVDPKTVQYLAGHENSKTTMDIYAKVKYNKPEELFEVVNDALHQRVSD